MEETTFQKTLETKNYVNKETKDYVNKETKDYVNKTLFKGENWETFGTIKIKVNSKSHG